MKYRNQLAFHGRLFTLCNLIYRLDHVNKNETLEGFEKDIIFSQNVILKCRKVVFVEAPLRQYMVLILRISLAFPRTRTFPILCLSFLW